MVKMYCAAHHASDALCPECRQLVEYADRRLDLCPYGADKPSCTNCPIHCYRPEQRKRMRDVMRFAGPRMAGRHPHLAAMHLLDQRRAPPPLAAHSRSSRQADDSGEESSDGA